MDNDLERSVRLLEDALQTPAKGLFKVAATTPKRDRIPNVSITMGPSELQRILGSDTMMFQDTMSMLIDHDKTVTGSVIQTATPWTSTLDNLYTEFADILQASSGGIEILDVAADLARCCSDALSVVQSLKSKVAVGELAEEKWLENERSNWRLLYVLYQDRLHANNANEDLIVENVGTSEKNCVSELFKRDNLIRESQLVVDWLERNALDKDDPILHHSDWTYGWEHTLHQLLSPDSIAIGSNVDIIKNIHPDAPQFQHLSLHHLDNDNDKKLCQRIFMEIRCGNLEGAQEVDFILFPVERD
jgi:nuclear pore complex protein Nup107